MQKIINFGVVGVGGFGQHHIAGIKENKNANLIMVCDNIEAVAAEVAERFDVPYTTNYDELLANDSIDAVCLAIPDQLHCEFAVKALNAGKHVLCEKPMTLKLDECKEMIKAADKTGKYLMVGQICRFTPSFIKAKELVDNGEIGELFFVEGEYAHDYEGMQTSWRFNPESPRHGMIGGGCHSVDLLRWIAGNPIETFAYSNHKILKDWPTDDCTIAVMKFPGDVIGKVFCSTGCKRRYTMRTVLYGDKGTIIVDNTSNSLSLFRKTLDGKEVSLGKKAEEIEIKIPVAVNNHNTIGEIAEFCDCILHQNPPSVDGREGATTVSICEAIMKSADEHRLVAVDYDF